VSREWTRMECIPANEIPLAAKKRKR
jgi:hypothetical protein